jgi:hypothetical protein
MKDRTFPPEGDITRTALQDYGDWTARFRSLLRKTAIELAESRGQPVVVTSEIIAEAVRLSCEELAAQAATAGREEGPCHDVQAA